MFDPWNSTLSEAEALQGGSLDPSGPLFQWAAAEKIKASRQAIEKGDGFAVLACIRDVVAHGLVSPEWLANEFTRRFDVVLNCRAKSWDDPKSFGRPYPKNTRINALRKQRILEFAVWNLANSIRTAEPRTPIDAGFFERVGQGVKPPIGKTVAETLYYLAKQQMQRDSR